MLPTEDLELGDLRLLSVDERILLPIEVAIGFITTADDVIHS